MFSSGSKLADLSARGFINCDKAARVFTTDHFPRRLPFLCFKQCQCQSEDPAVTITSLPHLRKGRFLTIIYYFLRSLIFYFLIC